MECWRVSKDIKKQNNKMYKKYHGIEIDQNRSRKEKAELMVEWYQKTQNLLCGIKSFNKRELVGVFMSKNVQLRYLYLYMFLLTACALSRPSKCCSLFLFIIY
jgi:hypothetical protein